MRTTITAVQLHCVLVPIQGRYAGTGLGVSNVMNIIALIRLHVTFHSCRPYSTDPVRNEFAALNKSDLN